LKKPIGDVEIGIGKDNVFFKTSEAIYVTSLVESQFPQYEAIIPKSKNTTLVINRKELLSALKMVDVFAQAANATVHPCTLTIPPGEESQVVVFAQDEETGVCQTTVKGNAEGPEIKIGFNASYLMDTLEAEGSDKVVLTFTKNNTPAIIKAEGENSGMVVLMPVHIGE
jgi:DNA polymerase-3 subunit beta